jgi:inhibitor of the pro-sigma K processing machinery
METEIQVFLAYAAGMLLVYVFGRFLLVPLKWILYAILSSIAGGAVILLINLLGNPGSFIIPLNMITASAAGILGLPGVIMLLLIFV